MSSASVHTHSAQNSSSAILMERVIGEFHPIGNLRQRLKEAGASEDLLANLVVVTPSETLEDYRFVYVGHQIDAHLGRELTGKTFRFVLDMCESFRACLIEFMQAIDQTRKIISYRRLDFSDKWMIEYSRIIYPVIKRDGVDCAVGYYVFHESDLEGRYL